MSPTPDMTNLQDTAPGPLLSAADFPSDYQPPVIIPTRRPLWQRLYRFLLCEYLKWCERSTIDERQAYQDAQVQTGEEYRRNSFRQERRLRKRIEQLERT